MDLEKLKLAMQIAEMISAGGAQSSATEGEEIPVVVWTDKRGVIFGYTKDVHARPIYLTNARMCLYWDKSTGGVFGLCEKGPGNNCKISATLPAAYFEGVTGVASVSPAAVKAWVDAPVHGRNDD